MIQFKQVYKRYPGGHEVLKNLNLEIGRGEWVYVTGHSGAGKSTLLKLVAAIERPSDGSVLLNGQNTKSLKTAALPYLRQKIGLVFQDHKLLYDRSAFDNVMLPLQIAGGDSRENAKRARAALDKVGLLAHEKSHPIALSGGEQQRLCIARAIVNRPELLLIDEPTGNLDNDCAHEIMSIFKSFHQVGVTLLLSSHDVNLLRDFPERTLTLNHGALVT